MLTLEEAKQLKYRQRLIDKRDGARWYVNGAVQLWKRDASRIRVPLKHGLYVYGALNTSDFTNGVCEYMEVEL